MSLQAAKARFSLSDPLPAAYKIQSNKCTNDICFIKITPDKNPNNKRQRLYFNDRSYREKAM